MEKIDIPTGFLAGSFPWRDDEKLFAFSGVSRLCHPNYAQQAQPDRYALWRQHIRHRQPVIVLVISCQDNCLNEGTTEVKWKTRTGMGNFIALATSLLSKLSRSGIGHPHNDSPLAKFFLLGQTRLVIGRALGANRAG
ncbi:MAG: hypothetical protein ACK5TN_19615 [Acidobacteriota bacterium]